MKRIDFVLTVLIFIILFSTTAVYAQEIKVVVSDQEAVLDQEPIMQDGRVLVPIRGVFELLGEGFTISWDDKTNTATIYNNWYTVKIKSGETSFTSNGKTITPDVPPQIINGRLLIPLRAISEAVDAEVDWDPETSTANIYYVPQVEILPASD